MLHIQDVNTGYQARTEWMTDGVAGMAVAGTTATWTNPGHPLPSGTYKFGFRVANNAGAGNATVVAVSTESGASQGDVIYFTIP